MAFTVFVALDERVKLEVCGDLCRSGRRADGSPNRPRRGVVAMLHCMRRSLLVQLLSVYLLFVVIVLLGGVGVNAVVAQKLRNDVQVSDRALAQEIALETSLHLRDAEQSLVALGNLALQASTLDTMRSIFHTFHDARSDVDQVSWLDPVGTIQVSWPPGKVIRLGAEFSPPTVVQRALNPALTSPVLHVGTAAE